MCIRYISWSSQISGLIAILNQCLLSVTPRLRCGSWDRKMRCLLPWDTMFWSKQHCRTIEGLGLLSYWLYMCTVNPGRTWCFTRSWPVTFGQASSQLGYFACHNRRSHCSALLSMVYSMPLLCCRQETHMHVIMQNMQLLVGACNNCKNIKCPWQLKFFCWGVWATWLIFTILSQFNRTKTLQLTTVQKMCLQTLQQQKNFKQVYSWCSRKSTLIGSWLMLIEQYPSVTLQTPFCSRFHRPDR